MRPSVAIAIATRGRPGILAETLSDLQRQVLAPDRIIVGYVSAEDILDAPQRFPHVEFLLSASGLTVQRNTILRALRDISLVLFLDDDFYLHHDYLRLTALHFEEHPEIVATTGTVILDGINGPGLQPADALAALAAPDLGSQRALATEVFNAYGCNMCFRLEVVRRFSIYFDETLPLYGWYEDVDFCRRLALHGKIIRLSAAIGVHLGVKSGRQSGLRLGYSQIANPVYLAQKCSVPWLFAVASLSSRFMKNLVRSASPEPNIDRRGRLRGNLLALRDLISGQISPMRILDL